MDILSFHKSVISQKPLKKWTRSLQQKCTAGGWPEYTSIVELNKVLEILGSLN